MVSVREDLALYSSLKMAANWIGGFTLVHASTFTWHIDEQASNYILDVPVNGLFRHSTNVIVYRWPVYMYAVHEAMCSADMHTVY